MITGMNDCASQKTLNLTNWDLIAIWIFRSDVLVVFPTCAFDWKNFWVKFMASAKRKAKI